MLIFPYRKTKHGVLKMDATAAKKIAKNAYIYRWSNRIKQIESELKENPYGDRTKLYIELGRLQSKIAFKKAKIVYGRDDAYFHVKEFY